MTVSILVICVPATLPKSLCLLLQSPKIYSLPSSMAFYIIIFIYASDLCVLVSSSVYFPYQHYQYLQVLFQRHLTGQEGKTVEQGGNICIL